MKCLYPSFYRIVFVLTLISKSFVSFSQDNHPLTCPDVRNGTFYYFDKKNGGMEIFIRKGALQREIIAKQKETVLWDVEWLNDCIYTLKYESGAENHPAAEPLPIPGHFFALEVK